MERSVANVANANKWIFTFTSMPGVTGTSIYVMNNMKLYLTRVTLPSIQFTEQLIDWLAQRTRVIHDPPEYVPINADFKIAEDFSNYAHLLAWANYISNNHTNIAPKMKDDPPIGTTSICEYYDPWGNPRVKWTFFNTILFSLGELTFDYQTVEEDLFCTASFVFDRFEFERISLPTS